MSSYANYPPVMIMDKIMLLESVGFKAAQNDEPKEDEEEDEDAEDSEDESEEED